jgi:hypothetical protein
VLAAVGGVAAAVGSWSVQATVGPAFGDPSLSQFWLPLPDGGGTSLAVLPDLRVRTPTNSAPLSPNTTALLDALNKPNPGASGLSPVTVPTPEPTVDDAPPRGSNSDGVAQTPTVAVPGLPSDQPLPGPLSTKAITVPSGLPQVPLLGGLGTTGSRGGASGTWLPGGLFNGPNGGSFVSPGPGNPVLNLPGLGGPGWGGPLSGGPFAGLPGPGTHGNTGSGGFNPLGPLGKPNPTGSPNNPAPSGK